MCYEFTVDIRILIMKIIIFTMLFYEYMRDGNIVYLYNVCFIWNIHMYSKFCNEILFENAEDLKI